MWLYPRSTQSTDYQIVLHVPWQHLFYTHTQARAHALSLSLSYLYTFIHIYIYIHAHIHTHIYTYIHIYIHTYIHTYVHTHTHTHIHTHIQLSVAISRMQGLTNNLWVSSLKSFNQIACEPIFRLCGYLLKLLWNKYALYYNFYSAP
jgi:hypothetical protein